MNEQQIQQSREILATLPTHPVFPSAADVIAVVTVQTLDTVDASIEEIRQHQLKPAHVSPLLTRIDALHLRITKKRLEEKYVSERWAMKFYSLLAHINTFVSTCEDKTKSFRWIKRRNERKQAISFEFDIECLDRAVVFHHRAAHV